MLNSLSAKVICIIRLVQSRRSWFVTDINFVNDRMHFVGFSPGCSHASGNWFNVSADFFQEAAQASQDNLEINMLDTSTPLDQLEDEAL